VFERFTSGARQAVTDAQGEARRLGHRHIGTEHLLLGLLAGQDGIAAAVLRDAGIDASTVESDVVRIVGRGPGSPAGAGAEAGAGAGPGADADADALRVLGIDLDAVRDAADAAFGPGALDWASVAVSRPARRRFGRGLRPFARRRRSCRTARAPGERPPAFPGGHIPFTPRAKKVLELSLREALALRHHYIGTEHVLLGLIREGEGLAAEVLVLRGVGLDDLRRRVLSALGNAA
jgi:hypothetical protein